MLESLSSHVCSLSGVGEFTANCLKKLGLSTLRDLVFYKPHAVIDRTDSPPLSEVLYNKVITVSLTVDQHIPSYFHKNRTKNAPYRVICSDATGSLVLLFFKPLPPAYRDMLAVGAKIRVSGRVEKFLHELQMAHPDYIVPAHMPEKIPQFDVIYPKMGLITHKKLGGVIKKALAFIPDLPEWYPAAWKENHQFSSWKEALLALHCPKKMHNGEVFIPDRLKYDELLAHHLALLLSRNHAQKQSGRATRGDGSLTAYIQEKLPFALTHAQARVIKEIEQDQQASSRMVRLLQGDVGSGKTVVALFAMARIVEAKMQAALMVPTDILANQHYGWISHILKDSGVKVGLLSRGVKGQARKKIIEDLASGEISIVIGTHALFQEKIVFHDLALAIIDEQHRFGVNHREALYGKGEQVDILLMTATPIPRTLRLACYGDMESSRLDEKPVGRKPIRTCIISLERLSEVVEAMKRALDNQEKIYWICPLVEDSELIDLTPATNRHAFFCKIFGEERVGLVHGQMKPEIREERILAFKEENIDLLVATTVIEVGIDVPQASVIVIEHAERFGLSQLHQLRGRVGRGSVASTCLLLYAPPSSALTQERLKILQDTEDGFIIAEKDLLLRGGGNLLGTQQSGMTQFYFASVEEPIIVEETYNFAKAILEKDPALSLQEHKGYRTLLAAFSYETDYLKT